jgi:pimeloyl-ACP methyl ester carboxylesterase
MIRELVTAVALARLTVAGLVLAALTPLPATAAPAPAPERPQLVERMVPLGDRMVRALCTSGPREAVLLQSDGDGADVWRPVLERLEGEVGACAYDRSLPEADRTRARGWFELLDEMQRVHGTLGFQRGYVLVGHGLGGMYARLYAAGRPTEVSALVLVDPAHENMPEEARHAMPERAWEDWMTLRRQPNADGVRESDMAKLARMSRPPAIPVTVVTARRRPDGPGWDERFLFEAARRVHASLLEGSTSGRHVPASASGHDVHLDEPELVAREITRGVRLSRAVVR